MKIGFCIPNFGRYANRENIIALSKAAEDLGFDSLWVSDHIVTPDTHHVFGETFFEPLATLSCIASQTRNIKLGTSVIVLPYRNPLVLAKMMSSLDVLSGGRVILGVGTGWVKEEFDAIGADYRKRGAITDEYLIILKELFSNDNPEYEGEYFKFSNILFEPKPVQKPYPPIWIGGNSKKAIERAVRFGNGWHAVRLTPEEVRESSEYIKRIVNDKFTISVRNNIQITDYGKNDERDLLRGSIDKIVEGISLYTEAGADHLILYILSGSVEGVYQSLEVLAKDIKRQLGN